MLLVLQPCLPPAPSGRETRAETHGETPRGDAWWRHARGNAGTQATAAFLFICKAAPLLLSVPQLPGLPFYGSLPESTLDG